MKYPKNLSGLKFGKLTVISKSPKLSANRQSHWNCICECGNEPVIRRDGLTWSNTKSCGCLSITHHMSDTPEFYIWVTMKQRCLNKNNHKYYRYGARGITICDRWLDSFENFYDDMGKRPSSDHSIGRHDNDGNYDPSNCSWEDRISQMNNKSTNVRVSFKGKTQTIAQWARELNINFDTLQARLKYYKWSVEKTLSTPAGKQGNRSRKKPLS